MNTLPPCYRCGMQPCECGIRRLITRPAVYEYESEWEVTADAIAVKCPNCGTLVLADDCDALGAGIEEPGDEACDLFCPAGWWELDLPEIDEDGVERPGTGGHRRWCLCGGHIIIERDRVVRAAAVWTKRVEQRRLF